MDNGKTPTTPVEDKWENPWYACTFTYARLNNKTPYGQFKETVVKLTEELEKSTTYELIPEWRPTTGEIHYHGILKIVDKLQWHTKTLLFLKKNGFVKLKHIDDMKKWCNYYNKDRILAETITKLHMPITQQVIVEKKVKKVIDIPDGETVIIEKEVLTEKGLKE